MKVHLIKEKTIINYVMENPGSRIPFEEGLSKLKKADWNTPVNIKNTYRNADLLGKSSLGVVFDIGGNNYRMISKYAFGEREIHLFVCWVGTHAEYDKLCADNRQYCIHRY